MGMKKYWETGKDSKCFYFMKCLALCYTYVIFSNLVGFVLPLCFLFFKIFFMWNIFKVYIEFVTILFLFYVLFF